MNCPSDKCGSSNVQSLPLYVNSLGLDAPNRRKYAQPAEGDRRAVAAGVGVAALGIVLAVMGGIVLGLLALLAGAGWAAVAYRRMGAADVSRAAWQRRQICLACTHLWVP